MTEWTKEQKQVIGLRNCSILVSAAAGSGKTAVLIERILSRITDPEYPVNIDEFLIVTFTKAAAAQMWERLQKALEEALQKNPDNEHLRRQIMLVPMAQISTIHSFCGYVIQNYFHRTGVDPAYRVGTDSEMGLLREDVMKEMLEEKYEEGSPEFMDMAIMSRFVKSDKEMEELIFMLYDKAMSEPFPKKFLERLVRFLEMDTVEELRDSEFVRRNIVYTHNILNGILGEYRVMLQMCDLPGGPFWYRDVLLKEKEQFSSLCGENDYAELGRKIGLTHFGRLPGKKQPDSDEELKEAVKEMRDAVKDAVKTLKGELFDCTFEEQLLQFRQMRGVILAFIHLTEEFLERFQAKKAERSLADFSDLEQMAMEILVEEDPEGNVRRTDAAEELSEQFAEIMIDEYQDSNLVQDMLLGSVVSGQNLFMVGDIKQSIYRFRMARPDLFLEKLGSYRTEEGEPNRLVNLSRNFRSRDIILEGTNAVFEKIMHRELGGVEYDEDARLRTGAKFPDTEKRTAEGIDVYEINGREDGSYEGKLIAGLIREYTGDEDPLYVYEGGAYRPAKYGDIVILARSTKVIGQQIYDALTAEGIPVHMENTQGFFDTREISIMVSLFQIIDNPRQDIPLAAVLRSPAFAFTDDELAIIRGGEKKRDFYDSLLSYREEDGLRKKIQNFLDKLGRFREKVTYATVADIIQDIYESTHIDYLLMAMKNGMQRKANLDLLLEVAREFDSTSYKGLHQFVRYISGIKRREEDIGEANLPGGGENIVRIMTIHKSKGLEFPVCVIAGMGRSLSGGRRRPFLMVNPDVGIAAPIVDNERGISINHTFYRSIARMNLQEDLGEELRVLYVAMTRAKEKLVLTGCVDEKKILYSTGYFQRIRAKSYFDWILPAIQENELFRRKQIEPEQLERAEVRRQADLMVDEVMLNNFDTNFTYNRPLRDMLRVIDGFQQEEVEDIPTKMSVSEIKKRSMEESAEEDFTVLYSDALENQSPVPAFAREDGEENQALAGAGYGTVWHQVMSGLDFSVEPTREELRKELKHMADEGRVKREELSYINFDKLIRFFKTSLGKEMREAWEAGNLYREQPFVISVHADEVLPDTDNDEVVLIQGIIDAFYETDEGIVLMDYKTDRLEGGQEYVLVERYKKQMELYARALQGIIGREVVRKVLYSFSLNKEIEVS